MTARVWLRRLQQAGRRVGRAIGGFQARLLLGLFYFLVVPPFAVAIRRRSDPLALGPRAARGWRPRSPSPGTPLERARRQY